MKMPLIAVALLAAALGSHAADKKLLMLAGRPSHWYMEHEYRAGCLLLQKCLANTPGLQVTVVSNDWPKDESVFEGVDAVFMFCTGGERHPAATPERLKVLDQLMKKGVGFGTCHYGVEVEKGAPGDAFLAWQGGYFETFWSVNPHWTADFKEFPNHPVARGIKPFKINDEWYYHMRFPEGMKGVTPILTALPPEKTRGSPGTSSTHGGNPHVQARKGQAEHVMWTYDRPDGGRGFGITGAHFHRNWGDDNFRKVVLNALLWIAKIDVPEGGVGSTVTPDELLQNLDPKKKIVLIAGKPSHPSGMHEFRAGMLLLKGCLDGVAGVTSTVYSNGWPQDPKAFEGANAVVIYADGGGGHPAIQGDHKKILNDLAMGKEKVGLGFMHYGVEIPSTNGGPEFLEWIGGYYEHQFSVNPMWSPEYKTFPNHPVARGVKPYSNKDEWYFNMRWSTDAKGITPILVASPSDSVRKGPYVHPKGPYDHIVAASGREETTMWVYTRPGGGRGFGFTGGHTHANWGDVSQRKAVLNAILWIANAEMPSNGVDSSVTPEQLRQNLDPKKK
jgi:type 1 glutamine amidotransferase